MKALYQLALGSSWLVPLFIIAVGGLAGLIAWLAVISPPAGCHLILAATPGKPHLTRVCP